MDLALLEQVLAARGEPAYRARQVWEWAARGVAGYEEMTNVPARLRAALAEEVPFTTLSLETEARSKDGTVKALFRTHDGHPVEAVLMRYRDGRRSLCLSTPVRLPAHVHVLRHGSDDVRPQPDGVGDARPGAPLPPRRGRRPRRVHGDGRAVPELRRGDRRRPPPARPPASRTAAPRSPPSAGCPA